MGGGRGILTHAKKEVVTADFEHQYARQTVYQTAEEYRMERIFDCGPYGSPDRLPHIAREIRLRVKMSAREVFIVGELLTEAKQITRGEFKAWIKEGFDFSYETAVNFMHVYRACFGRIHVAENVKPSILYTISAPSFPERLREYLFEKGGLDEMTGNDLFRLKKLWKEGREDAVEAALTKVTRAVRARQQCAYAMDQVLLVLLELEKAGDRLEAMGTGNGYLALEDQRGHEPVGDELRVLLANAITAAHERIFVGYREANELLRKLEEQACRVPWEDPDEPEEQACEVPEEDPDEPGKEEGSPIRVEAM